MFWVQQPTDDTDVISTHSNDNESVESSATVHELTDDDQHGVIGLEEAGLREDAPIHDEHQVDPLPQPRIEEPDTAVDVGEAAAAAVPENEPGQDDDEESDDTIHEPDRVPDLPRRSVRHRTSTATTKYKDFVTKQMQHKADWLTRAQFLRDSVLEGLFRGSEDRVKEALLKLITDTDV